MHGEFATCLNRCGRCVKWAADITEKMVESQADIEERRPTVFVVDDDAAIREGLVALLEEEGFAVQAYSSANDFLDAYQPGFPGCLLLDINMPGTDGLKLQGFLAEMRLHIPIIFLTGQADISKTTQAFKKGAFDFLEKPVATEILLERITQALAKDARQRAKELRCLSDWERIQQLTQEEREVMALITAGHSNKQIARELNISTRTVEGHRRRVFEKTGAKSFANLIEIARNTGHLQDMKS